ncbi:MAG: fibronectin type III domain-containing protein [Candidatus Nanopelagicales bacterium]
MRARSLLALPLAVALLTAVVPAAQAWSNSALLGPVLSSLPAQASGGGSGTAELNQAVADSCASSGGVALIRWFSLPAGELGLIKAQGQGSIEWSTRVPPEVAVHQAILDATSGSVISCTGVGRVSVSQRGVVAVWFDTAEYQRARSICANPMYGCYEPTIALAVGPTTGAAPSNDHVADATLITSLPFDVAGDRSLADDDGPMLVSGGAINHQVATVWYRFVAPATGLLPASAAGSAVGLGHVTSSGIEAVEGFGVWPVTAGESYLVSVSTVVYDYARYDPMPRGRYFHLYVGAPGTPAAPAIEATSGADGAITVTWTGDGTPQTLDLALAGPGAGSAITAPWGSGPQARTISALESGAEYELTARLRNTTGVGVPTIITLHAGRSAQDGSPAFLVDAAVDARSANAAATITWSGAYEGPQPVTGYIVARDGTDTYGTGPWSTTVDAVARSFVFKHLVRGTTYRFSVTPVTSDGERPTASVSAPVLSVPVAPGGDLGLTYSGGTIFGGPAEYTMRWTEPASDGQSPIIGYRVTRDGHDVDGDGPISLDLPADARSFVLTKLRGDVNYRIGVRAINAVGAGPEESLLAAQMDPVPPTAPTGVKAVPGDGSATVSWTPPTTWGSLPPASYRIYTRMDGGPSVLATWADKAATSANVPGLFNGHSYAFTVQAWSTDSVSPESDPSEPVLIDAPPQPVVTVPWQPRLTGISARAVGGRVVAKIAWAASPTDGGSPIKAYRVYAWRVTSVGRVLATILSPRLAPDRRLWTMTLPMSHYRFTVRAVNAVGYSNHSDWSRIVSVAKVPSPPRIGSATSGVPGGSLTATVRWAAPASTGGAPVIAYRVYAFWISNTGEVRSYTFSPRLASGTRSYTMTLPRYALYRFAVKAINAMGDSLFSAKSTMVLGR